MQIKSLSVMFMISSTFMMMTTDDPMIMWMMMEMSTMMFMTMCASCPSSIKATPLMLPIQFSSSMMILSASINEELSETWSTFIMSMAISMKLGLFPFESWVIKSFKYLSWYNCLIMMTLMKIPTLMFITLMQSPIALEILSSSSAIALAMKSMMAMSNKTLMALSSGIHSSWMTILMMSSMTTWMVYFLLYSISMVASIPLIKLSIPNPMSTCSLFTENKMIKMAKILAALSMMGVPPLIMFMIKLNTIKETLEKFPIPTICLIMSSMLMTIMYSRLFNSSMSNNQSSKLFINSSIPPIVTLLLFMMILMTPLILLLV